MDGYNLSLFTVLVVDDNSCLRNLLRSILLRLGSGNVVIAGDGGEAIELLKLMQDDPRKAGISSVDFIMSNWEMSPVDGIMLLKWLRRHKDSSDKFMPFILVTGHADMEKVREARDLGATEVLGKPYSIQSLTRILGQLIERPRQYVLTPVYFGPDRRRRRAETSKGERRIITDKEAEVIYDDGNF